ncbi:processed acidic surface protein [Sutcliffiella halmapala]|uniref:processed acidic surface protein n=1 Tax=Sutcliffiella halmapala TaxID=79882 RepID=UPI0014733A92|nr:processed acidic surface protein [Sutcliffiella halmapala]
MMRFVATICTLILFLSIIGSPVVVLAAPTEKEVDQYLKEISWTRHDLDTYLKFYEVSLDDFKDIDHLQSELGTPINKDNLHEILNSYNLTEEELEILLSRFGEKVQDYTFLEDLEIAVDFYLTHEDEVARAEDFLVSVGFKAEEARLIFQHIIGLPNEHLQAELQSLEQKLAEEPNTVEKIFSLWSDFMNAFQVTANLHMENRENKETVTQEQMLQPGWLEGKIVHLELFNNEGELLATAKMGDQIISPSYVQETGEELINLGKLGVKLSNELYHNRMPNTASIYGIGMASGLFLVVLASILFRKTGALKRG